MPVPCSTQCGKNAVLKVQYAFAKYILYRPITVFQTSQCGVRI